MGSRIASSDLPGAAYVGEVVHKRVRPRRHVLRYRVFSLLVDVDRLDDLDRGLRLLSVDRFNLFAIHRRDFGPHDGSSLGDFIRKRARAAGLDAKGLSIQMLAYPRLLGYGFNPLTIYYLKDASGCIRMLVYEVRNTFGEHHFYDARVNGREVGAEIVHSLGKAFYVSPFNTVEGNYRFSMRPPGEGVFSGITLSTSDGPLLTAWFEGARRPLSDATLAKLALAYPLMTAKVIAGIHWEAFRLWVKGVPLTLRSRREMRRHEKAAEQGRI